MRMWVGWRPLLKLTDQSVGTCCAWFDVSSSRFCVMHISESCSVCLHAHLFPRVDSHVCLGACVEARQYHPEIIAQVLTSFLLWRQRLAWELPGRLSCLGAACFCPSLWHCRCELPCQQFFFLSSGIKGEGKCHHTWPGFSFR